jgi:hypothetical protein
MQLALLFQLELEPSPQVWTALDEAQRVAVEQALAKLIARAAQEALNEEAPDND